MTTESTTADDGPREGLDTRDNGTTHVWLNGVRYRLRRPRGREFRRLRESFGEVVDENDQLVAQMRAITDPTTDALIERKKSDPEAEFTIDEKQKRRRAERDYSDAVERVILGWWREVFDVLGVDGQTPFAEPEFENDEAPIWLCTFSICDALLDHWRSRPSLSGVR